MGNRQNTCAIYVRLSRDEDKENYESLMTQKDALIKYAATNDLEVVDTYIDDNVSGYVFEERPEFIRMVKDLVERDIHIVLAKDLSRIGRNNGMTLLFLENIKNLDKRIILADDNYDSNKDDDDIIGIKSWYNERYVKDISKKIRYNIKQLQETGKFVIRETYGYKKVGNTLVVDDVTAPIIKTIFKLYKEGYGYRKISNFLTEKSYPTPSMVQDTNRSTTELWNTTHINRILKNEIYIGTFYTRKTIRKSIKSKQVNRVPKDDWICFEDNHPAIISKDDFNLVQSMIDKRNTRNIRAGTGVINLFAGFIFCEECGSPMFCIKRNDRATHYQCGNYYKHGTKLCTSHRIPEQDLILTLLDQVDLIRLSYQENLKKIDENIKEELHVKENYDKIISKITKQIQNKKSEVKMIYKDKIKGLIDEEMYVELTKENAVTINLLEEQLNSIFRLRNIREISKEEVKKGNDMLENIVKSQSLTREHLEILIQKIIVNKDKKISKIHWNADMESMSVHNQVITLTHRYSLGQIDYKELSQMLSLLLPTA